MRPPTIMDFCGFLGTKTVYERRVLIGCLDVFINISSSMVFGSF